MVLRLLISTKFKNLPQNNVIIISKHSTQYDGRIKNVEMIFLSISALLSFKIRNSSDRSFQTHPEGKTYCLNWLHAQKFNLYYVFVCY